MVDYRSQRWTGPYTIRDLLSKSHLRNNPRPQEHNGVYVVTVKKWRTYPKESSIPLYAGTHKKESKRFRTRIGDLIADAFGFFVAEENRDGSYNRAITGHSSGGTSLYYWCKDNQKSPMELYLAWAQNPTCRFCLESNLIDVLRPSLNKRRPSCEFHWQA